MIKPDQIPLEVKRAMRAAWVRRNNSDAPERHMADLAVAALNAWPEARLRTTFWPNDDGVWIVPQHMWSLPLPQENSDD